MKTIETPRPAFGAAPGASSVPSPFAVPNGQTPSPFGQPASTAAPASKPASGSSFLDEWLAKRGSPAPRPAQPVAPAPVAPAQPTPQATPPAQPPVVETKTNDDDGHTVVFDRSQQQ